jgi:aspartokinase/homoserine dehydrogenase 1
MTRQILKFGGSSLGRLERLTRVLEIVERACGEAEIELVVSAFGDTTDHLLEAGAAAARGALDEALALTRRVLVEARTTAEAAAGQALGEASWAQLQLGEQLERLLGGIATVGELSPATRDELLSFGERISVVLVAAALTARGLPAVPIDARDWVVTDDRHGDATVQWEPTLGRLRALADQPGRLRVHTGFLGRTTSGRTTTLGRNGSDYTAALLARARQADELHIWTDVSGVMTADPSLVDEAYPVRRLSYREAIELAGLGLKMLHPRTVLPLLESGIPMRIRNTLAPLDPGTLVDAVGATHLDRPTCVTSLEGMTLLDVEGTQRTAAATLGPRVVGALGSAGIPVWFETQAPRGNGVALVVSDADAVRARALVVEALGRELGRGDLEPPRLESGVTLLTLVAEAMGRTVNVAGRFFGALGIAGINVKAASQGATSRAISCVVSGADTPIAVRAVHAALNLAREQVSVLLLGKGTVGGQLLLQLGAEQQTLREQHDLDVRLVGLVDSQHALFDPRGVPPRQASERLPSAEPQSIESLLDALSRLPVPVLVDCTAADGMERVYHAAFARGIHVVAANKKPLTLPLFERAQLFEAARRAHRAYRYETTVGASLPVIDTLKNLVRTGDRVLSIEGSLSGTLGYLSNALTQGERLSVAVAEARRRGYTEPHPRDDLGGVDAARKALILARELGLELELADVVVEPFVPRALLAHDDLDRFFDALRAEDAAFEARMAGLRAEGRVLRYLAQIDPGEGALEGTVEARTDGEPPTLRRRPSLRVGPVGVPADHPATRLRGTEAFVAFTTERYREYPLVVQGAGAGGAVTAAGVLADVLALSQSLRGR